MDCRYEARLRWCLCVELSLLGNAVLPCLAWTGGLQLCQGGVVRGMKSLDRETGSPVAGGERQEQQNGMESVGSSTALNSPKWRVFLVLRGVFGAAWSVDALRAARLEALGRRSLLGLSRGDCSGRAPEALTTFRQRRVRRDGAPVLLSAVGLQRTALSGGLSLDQEARSAEAPVLTFCLSLSRTTQLVVDCF